MHSQEVKDGSLRILTPGEIHLARAIYRNTIKYHQVWIHKGSYLPFGLQQKHVSMAPNGEIYFRNDYRPDFSMVDIRLQQLFIHEMAHVWQYQQGMSVRLRGLISWAVDYHYQLGRPLKSYTMEQQAQIIADYYVLTQPGGRKNWYTLTYCNTGKKISSIHELLALYQETLKEFPL